jgi:hypothetical protein
VKLFRTIWGNLATRGICDEIGGLEYRTVLAQWIDRGYPGYGEPNSDDAIGAFIREKVYVQPGQETK